VEKETAKPLLDVRRFFALLGRFGLVIKANNKKGAITERAKNPGNGH